MSGKKFVATFICLWIIWLMLTGAIDNVIYGIINLSFPSSYSQFMSLLMNNYAMQELVIGGIVSALVAALTNEFFTESPGSIFNPVRWVYLIAYIPAYIWEEIKAHLNVALRILDPRLSISPSIVELPSNFKSEDKVGLTALANSITMTPGTLTVEIDEGEPRLFVHWITAGDKTSPEEAFDGIGKPFERFLNGGLGG